MMKPQVADLDKPLTLTELMRGAAAPEAGSTGPRYWRSLSELADDGAFSEQARTAAARAQAAIFGLDDSSRRKFLTLMGASFALAGVTGCGVQPLEKIVPYVEQPELIVPGKPLFFATASSFGGDGVGLLVESQMGRPTKIEGNPSHPTSRGATDIFAQAEVLNLYDPDRSQVVVHDGRVDTWERFLRFAIDLRERKKAERGRGLRLLTRSVASPTELDQIRRLRELMPEAKWHSYEPVNRDASRKGAELALGSAFEVGYHLEKADVVVALDADLLGRGPAGLRHARAFADRRDPDGESPLRLYAFEPTPTLTGVAADRRTPVASADVLLVLAALARALKVEGAPELDGKRIEPHAAAIVALAAELEAAKGKALVVVGDGQPAEAHALALAVNAALGAIGETLTLAPPAELAPVDQTASLVELARDIESGAVDTLFVLGANPVYEAPSDLKMGDVLQNPKLTALIHLGLHNDETGAISHWHIPEAHFLEAWGDVRSADGTCSLQQPLIEPLYQGRSASDVLAALLGEVGVPGQELVRSYWRTRLPAETFEQTWRKALRDGVVDLPAPAEKAAETPTAAKLDKVQWPGPAVLAADELEIVFRPDPTIWDGRYANNGWLQELPKPLTTLTWDNAALVSPALAKRLGLEDQQVVLLEFRSSIVEAPVLITPGQAEDTVTVHLGYGRARAGRVGNGIGFDAYRLRRSDAPWAAVGLKLTATTKRIPLAITQHHHRTEGREPVKVTTFAEYKHPGEGHGHHPHPDGSLYPDPPVPQSEDYAWGMAIDLNRCIGCGSCTIACQSENNIPIVGKDQVLNSREMHWIRVDRYYEGDDEANPATHFQPVPCMHCEKAPCELVCPVEATTHSDEGLNEMTYNRCVGTRYCGNNCPYKVRRFNFLEYTDNTTPSLQLLRNPDVTVRMRGVMEKCTYCVQRINEARQNAKVEHRKVGGDEVATACQAACPTRAIVFGNLLDPESSVSKLRNSPRNYALLEELGTKPRTTYLTKLTHGAEAHEEPRHG
ncbi:TAT-variant-translocated molybdopterin oxidoreductase [Planctomyces sp. SH-PL62]|uniref:TAT-variant-translocated molybdopterin oxidoreductase n=1 Tax=Planctomyces sp. SH-PL62 TaxID=1636152 RepID=UPI00078CDBF1|nr:TAT-variant-translocated molybdopterin oxidoreductase [Planctomyces sp. SH-PL62]AMV40892.1 Tetrathionate reductase subunit B precursor [Planctomyces sp. SH-PL62]